LGPNYDFLFGFGFCPMVYPYFTTINIHFCGNSIKYNHSVKEIGLCRPLKGIIGMENVFTNLKNFFGVMS